MKKKLKNIIIILFTFLCLIGLFISIFNIIRWAIDAKKTDRLIRNIQDKVDVNEIEDNNDTKIINQSNLDSNSPYWDYIKMNLIDVDFDELKKINNQTKGWIKVNGTNINYPFVQTSNNKYYLNHSFDKSYNSAGWVFLDYRNDLSSNDKNTIIYAHGRLDKTMFGTLKNILTNGWLDNSNNYVVKMSNEYENTLWQVFSVYKIHTTSDYLKINFSSDEEFLKFGNKLLNRSTYNFNTSLSKNNRILTLSTCYNNNERVVLHAKLIKEEIK